MTKRIISIALSLVLALCLFAGCSGASGKDIDGDALYSDLKALAFTDELVDMDMSAIENYYFFDDTGVIEKARVCKSASGATAEEIAVITVKSASDVESIKKALEMRVDDLAFNFENYVPAEMNKINKAIVTSNGRTVVLVVTDDLDNAQSTIDRYFK